MTDQDLRSYLPQLKKLQAIFRRCVSKENGRRILGLPIGNRNGFVFLTLLLAGLAMLAVAVFPADENRAAEDRTADATKRVSLDEIRTLREKAARRKRRLVVHSDGYPMTEEHRGVFEPTAPPSVFPQLARTQTDACTYSLIHQFPVARLYRAKVAQEWPQGIIKKMYGDGPDGLDAYIELCRRNNFEAFWAMRMNDTHDASDGPHGVMRWKSNLWKQAHPEFLVAPRGTPLRWGQWSALDYARPEVREMVFRVLEEVCSNYEIDGLLLDFFRHLPTFKTTVLGDEATAEEVEMLTNLFRRIRRMADEVGAERGRPILLAVRTPDSLGYAKALGLDLERWMKDDLIDIWIATGYFRLQDWSETVAIAHEHEVQLWAALDDSRIVKRDNRNSLEVYRGRIQNAWNAGVDAVWLFNFFYGRDDPQFQLLKEAGDPDSLARTSKVYVAEGRGFGRADHFLKNGERFFTRPLAVCPSDPVTLKPNETATVPLQVGDNVSAVAEQGDSVQVKLRIQTDPGIGSGDLVVRFNADVLKNGRAADGWVEFDLLPAIVKHGENEIIIARGRGARRDPVVRDLQLSIRYETDTSADTGTSFRLGVSVTSELAAVPLPLDPEVDFGRAIKDAGGDGILDPGSIEVRNTATGGVVPHSLGEGFHYGDSGRVRWVTTDVTHTDYEIRFQSTRERRPPISQAVAPMIGVGDLLRYNADQPRPLALRWPSRLVDLTGDGRLDLVGALPHIYAPRSQHGGIVCYPQTGVGAFEFGEMVRLRFKERPDDTDKHFTGPYLVADVADVNRDGRADLIYTTTQRTTWFQPDRSIYQFAHIYLNTGRRDAGGLPVFVFETKLPLPTDPQAAGTGGHWWGPVRVVDLNNDGALDLTVGRMFNDESATYQDTTCDYLRNTNAEGWPMRLAEPVKVDAGCRACFYDVDGDGMLDAVGLTPDPDAETAYRGHLITWRKGLGGEPPRFGPPQHFAGHDLRHSTFVSAVDTKQRRGILFNDKRNHGVSLLEQPQRGELRFERRVLSGRAADVVVGDQASPFPCDWEADGDWDLVVGGGNGWPQIIINEGTNERPRFAAPQPILSEGRPIRIFMSQVFPGIEGYGHDMGYPFPSYVDWDGDTLPDLMLPNITNRVFYYRNIGTRQEPKFGPRQQVIVDDYPETAATLAATAKLLGAGTQKWGKRMFDPNSPFGWRARAGFADFNGDGLMDMVHADGRTRNASGYADQYALFVQYRDDQGQRKLRRDQVITLPDGQPLKGPGGITSQAIPADWDQDGLIDLICHMGPSNTNCQPMFVRNIGTKTDPRFDHPRPLALWGEPLFNLMKHGPYWAIHDFDSDGRPDLLAGCAYGNYAFYCRTAMDLPARPSFEIGRTRMLKPESRK